MAAQSAKRLLGFEEAGSSPAHRHISIAIVGHPATDPPYLRVGRLDDVGRRQAARQLASHPEAIDGEQLLQAFKQTWPPRRDAGLSSVWRET